jgi:hypothetical protein
MDGLHGPDSAASAVWQARLIESRAADAAPWAPYVAGDGRFDEEEPLISALAAADPADDADPATDQQRMLHFMSHVNAECFISLLQVTDPLPENWQARSEYRKFYRQLRDTLTTPILPIEPE